MSDEILPSSEQEKLENPTPPTNQDPAGGNPAPAPASPSPSADAEKEALRQENDRLKQDYANSTKEAQILIEKNKQSEARVKELTTQYTPTEQELRAAFPEWDNLLPHEKRLATENLGLKRSIAAQQNTLAELQADRMWEKDLKKAVKAFPALSGREDEFEQFVMKPSHRGVPVETLAKSFLFDPKAPEATPPAPTPRTGPERGSGGPKADPTPKKITPEEAKVLRETNYPEYKRQLELGNIDLDI
jgi:hypothetical protein